MTRLELLVDMSRTLQRAHELARELDDPQLIVETHKLGARVAQLVGECVTGREDRVS